MTGGAPGRVGCSPEQARRKGRVRDLLGRLVRTYACLPCPSRDGLWRRWALGAERRAMLTAAVDLSRDHRIDASIPTDLYIRISFAPALLFE